MNEETGSARVGKPSALVGEYLRRVQDQLSRTDDGWLLYIEQHVTWMLDGNGAVVRSGGTMLVSKAHGEIAELTIRDTDDGEIVLHVEPRPQITWNIAKILMLP